ncbi:GNAT family N-acetyltransferase [Deinococcus yavapaiensis]|uniref:N-acetylglutamate synthase-like GNAT family acetyltransferase n=1 Tax=Deinococcus yavapaiensis KR-236 TaxID=694435 RepID=A0A318S7F9_9DEIO|nr:GNAT family N-acetyltransferase [Deinococcus yavapaiensis]PYE51120.1 N-acetylglutamate synthase-like GNAT family acetyltransferase [Deinococcus yavapaiensis KR-236]
MTNAEGTAIKIKPATDHDFGVVQDLIVAVGLAPSKANLSATPDNSTYWIAWDGSKPIGVLGLEHGDGASLLRSAAVLPEWRGRGVGRALARSALTYASLRGDRAVYLFSSGAGGYWRKFDFRQVPVAELAAILPNAPQVVSGVTRGWIDAEVAWRLSLATSEAVAC